MKKLISVLSLCIAAMFASCEGDDTIVNVPPDMVENVNIEVVAETLVRMDWEPANDANNDEVTYDVIVNDRVLATKTTETSLSFDTVQIIEGKSTKSKKELFKDLAKGLNLTLEIRILAYDTNGGVSDPMETTKTVFVNRDPGEFEFINIYFDFNYYNWLEISWTQATDEDGDILSYDIYINDTVIQENYVIDPMGFVPPTSHCGMPRSIVGWWGWTQDERLDFSKTKNIIYIF